MSGADDHRAGLPILAFPTLDAWAAWLAAQPRGAKGAWLKFAKQGSGETTLTKQDAIDGALMHGWIDGQLDKYDDRFWLARFTPRKPGGAWSANNRARALQLIEQGRIAPAGVAEIEAARADGRWDAAYAPASTAQPPPDLQAALDAAPAAKAFFSTLTGANRYAVVYRVNAAKKAETRAARIAKFVGMLSRGETLHPGKTT